MTRARLLLALALAGALGLVARPAAAQVRIADLTTHPGDVTRRIVGYGLVVGLNGTGDRSFGSSTSANPSVRSVVNLLRRFQVEVPSDRLRLRNVAAVAVTAEISPYLRAGNRFEVQVSALGDATSLAGGVLWMTPLVEDPGAPPIATAQGPLATSDANVERYGYGAARSNAARIPEGGSLEEDPPAPPALSLRLLLKRPDWTAARRIAGAIEAAFGAGAAKVEDAGALTLVPPAARAGDLPGFLASVDSLGVEAVAPARVVLDAQAGTIVGGGELTLDPAVITRAGYTLQIGGGASNAGGGAGAGLVRMNGRATVADVAAALAAAGAKPTEVASIFESLRTAGALHAEVLVR